MMRNTNMSMLLGALLAAATTAWTTPVMTRPSMSTMLFMASVPGEMENGDNPCWQDLYDDDCSMESVYSASFVAAKWIKSMPCGAGIEVRTLDLMRD
jgi:hypothetical protein